MHYYGTYALARAEGIRADVAEVIATASQYVDDSTAHRAIPPPAGAVFKIEVTSHHPTDLPANDDDGDQRRVWVPFHFFPGGEGSELTDKLICVKDSALAREMVSHHLGCAERPWAVELIGITAH